MHLKRARIVLFALCTSFYAHTFLSYLYCQQVLILIIIQVKWQLVYVHYFLLDNYFEAPEDKAYDATPDSGIHELGITDPEQRAKFEEDWKTELVKV